MTDDTATQVLDAIEGRRTERRRFLAYAGGATAGTAALSLLAACGADGTASTTSSSTVSSVATTTTEVDVFNFALNLEYLEAQFYAFAAYGTGLSAALLTGVGTQGSVTGGAQVPFTDPVVAQYAREIAADEAAHVTFLRSLLQSAAVAMPAINIDGSSATGAFSVAAQAAGVVAAGGIFNPYASDENFLLGAFLFEDVGVSAYKGASPLLSNPTYISNAAGILATEAYHAGLIRSVLYRKGIEATPSLLTNAQKLSDARDSLDGSSDDDQGIGDATVANITPADPTTAIAYSRSTGQVLNIVYLNKASVKLGGFFPAGVNGNIFTSAPSG
ncbi:ferritin-like domain-containing protein [Sphingomonas bacterium]|uniref:ferritin-like domain-containing protein n=1 Tax=Sphingomonas bacterium TaxID=1895847 RepID=UPI0015771814|nr:ferritin-like domain-containing protein [Sphingomonas bacterium]